MATQLSISVLTCEAPSYATSIGFAYRCQAAT
jgi:hypothetical protein